MKVILIFYTLTAYSEGVFFRNHHKINFKKILFPQNGDASPERYSFVQRLNHHQSTDNRVWEQFYWMDKRFYEEGGPVYLFLGGESPADPAWMNIGYWSSHGQDNNALLIILEHRFYGMSRPTNDTSIENLQYLTVEMALGDIAYFITEMNRMYNLSEETKWIVIGGSYAGSLAAWGRLKFPQLIYGAVASSAPLLAKLDFHEYYENVHQTLSQYNEKCAQDIATANAILSKLLITKIGRKIIGKIFRLCDPLTNRRKDWSFFSANLADFMGYTVQYNDNSTDSLVNIASVCNEMLKNESRNPVIRYANTIHTILEKFEETCIESRYSRFIERLRRTAWESVNADRLWLYQTCTEFGFFPTSSKKNDTFGPFFPASFFVSICSDVFGSDFNTQSISRGVNRTNVIFGERKIDVENVVFVHGSVDPWHSLGIIETDENKSYVVIYIPGASHCQDMNTPKSTDSVDLQDGRNIILTMLDSYMEN